MLQDSRSGSNSRIRLLFCWAVGATIFAVAGLAGLGTTHAQVNPTNRPIRLLVGFSAGGATDIAARVLAGKLSESLGQQIFVENRTGAGGTIATEAVARSEPDGTTLLMTPLANAANETLFKDFRYKYDEYFTAVAAVAETANVLVVHPSLNVKSVAELIALAKSRPRGEILAASPGVGTAGHLANELFNMMAGIKLTSVQYRGGGDVVKDLVSGQIKLMIAPIPTVLPFVQNGSLWALATTGPKRDSALPDLPTVAESGLPGFDVRLWLGILAPVGTSRPIIDRMAAATSHAIETPEVKAAFAAQGFDPLVGTPDQFAAFYRSEVEKWRKVIEVTGISIN
jgi:tripartite-type tricarboxylate transporter receptor subunit TctC